MNQKLKNELILGGAILVLAAFSYVGYRIAGKEPAAVAEVSVDGHVIYELPLNLESDFTIESSDGGTNHLVIKNETAYIDEADCPDGTCIYQGAIKESGQTIVCLPHRVLVTIK